MFSEDVVPPPMVSFSSKTTNILKKPAEVPNETTDH